MYIKFVSDVLEMIEVNVWMPTTKFFGKRIKSALGSFFSATFNENAGHVNFVLTVPEETSAFQKLEANHYELNVVKSMALIGQSSPERSVLGFSPAGTLKFWQPKQVRINSVTHSFWPATQSKKSVLEDILHLMHLAPRATGVPSEIASHEEDMKREASVKDNLDIKHHVHLGFNGKKKHVLSSLQKRKINNQELATKVNDLEVALEEKEKLQQKLQDLTSRKENLSGQIVNMKQPEAIEQQSELTAEYKKLQQQESFLLRKLSYLEKMENFDEKTVHEHLEVHERLFTLRQQKSAIELEIEATDQFLQTANEQYQSDLQNLQTNLQILMLEINRLQDKLKTLEEDIIQGQTISKVAGLKALHKMNVDALHRKTMHQQKNNTTEGKPAEHTLKLPTTDSGLPFCVDEELVLEAMQAEQKKNYSFIHANCAASAKRCLLAGIMHIKNELIANAGFSENDFIIHTPETCKSMRAWMKKLENGLEVLNFPQNSLDRATDESISSSSVASFELQ
ncbi:hypothetical protein [Legionella jamestowniensis]|uniref:Uncharacterized protein n=1 Tax=Legionella jamestowniensis TaxID=455 RepID=A0A0W0UZJ6_9GAMM|nr:hypothetical protein [Legionella jamestowniensis]KTD13284.1 hypothetical protein Ljam_0074 [Legionella jamestowniensis]SFL77661.1 hypothetical protein SAMN02746073_1854 [Legionella jamestowniensis DSM 19215]